MLGAIIGDIVGSRFERDNHKSKAFEMFSSRCRPTDDTIMSLAVADAILECAGNKDILPQKTINSMQELGRIYKNAGYGGSFRKWIMTDDPQPYNSYGNGSAMRVSPCGWAAGSLEEAKELSKLVTRISHNHPEGMKGAEAVAVAVYLAKSGESMENIRKYIEEDYYKIFFKIDQIRRKYKFDSSCRGSVPVALEAFFESTDFEDAIRIAVSVGGDTDTIAAITGSVAEAFYGIPPGLVYRATEYLDSRQMEILYNFEKKYPSKALDEEGKATVSMFEVLDSAADHVIPTGTNSGSVDKRNIGREILDKAGYEVAKAGKRAAAGILSAARAAKGDIDDVKATIEANTDYYYEIRPYDSEDTEDLMYVANQLESNGFHVVIHVSEGTLHGYVKLKAKDLNRLEKFLVTEDGQMLKLSKLDKSVAETVRKYFK